MAEAGCLGSWLTATGLEKVGCQGFIVTSVTRLLRDVGIHGQAQRQTVKETSVAAMCCRQSPELDHKVIYLAPIVAFQTAASLGIDLIKILWRIITSSTMCIKYEEKNKSDAECTGSEREEVEKREAGVMRHKMERDEETKSECDGEDVYWCILCLNS